MTVFASLRRFRADQSGSTAVEFAMVALLFIGLMLGTIDMARLMWELNSAKAATRAAVRLAAVSEPAAATFVDYDATTALSLNPGDPVPAAGAGGPDTITCTSGGCSEGDLNNTTFNSLVTVMQAYYGRVEPENVVVRYEPVGLGFAGNPYGPDVEPLVTVRLCNAADSALGCTPIAFSPGILQAFGFDPFNMPVVASSLSGEDLT